MENSKLVTLDYEDIRHICHNCNKFETIDWYTAPHINIKHYQCRAGGCKELAECYNKEQFLDTFQMRIIKKFL